jgi:hypothetical protein
MQERSMTFGQFHKLFYTCTYMETLTYFLSSKLFTLLY